MKASLEGKILSTCQTKLEKYNSASDDSQEKPPTFPLFLPPAAGESI